MASKNRDKKTDVPTSTGPVPVGTVLYRALEAVAQAVADELAKRQSEQTPAVVEQDMEEGNAQSNFVCPHSK